METVASERRRHRPTNRRWRGGEGKRRRTSGARFRVARDRAVESCAIGGKGGHSRKSCPRSCRRNGKRMARSARSSSVREGEAGLNPPRMKHAGVHGATGVRLALEGVVDELGDEVTR